MQTLLSLFKNLFSRREPSYDEQFLAAAVDLADLERRMRQLDDRHAFNAGSFRLATSQR